MYGTMTIKIFAVMFISGALLFAGCSRRYAGRWYSDAKRSERMMTHLEKELGLNEIQKAQLEQTVSSMGTREEAIGRESFIKEVLSQLNNEKVDEAHLNTIISNKHLKVDEMMRRFVTNIADFHGTLTPNQRTTLVKLIEKNKERGHRRPRNH